MINKKLNFVYKFLIYTSESCKINWQEKVKWREELSLAYRERNGVLSDRQKELEKKIESCCSRYKIEGELYQKFINAFKGLTVSDILSRTNNKHDILGYNVLSIKSEFNGDKIPKLNIISEDVSPEDSVLYLDINDLFFQYLLKYLYFNYRSIPSNILDQINNFGGFNLIIPCFKFKFCFEKLDSILDEILQIERDAASVS